MNSSAKKPGSGGGDDPNIPVLTDRLGFPPLEFDTTLPMIDSTLGRFEDSSLNIPTVQPIDAPAAPAQALYEAPVLPAAAPVPAAPVPVPSPQPTPQPAPQPAPAYARAAAPVSAPAAPPPAPRGTQLPNLDAAANPTTDGPRVYGGAYAPLDLPPMPAAPPPPPPAPPPAAAAAPVRPAAPPVLGGASGASLADANLNWARIESEACNAVVRKIAERLPLDIETVVRKQMAPTIDRLIAGLANETRLAIAASVREIVTQAVHAEIERMRRSTRGPN